MFRACSLAFSYGSRPARLPSRKPTAAPATNATLPFIVTTPLPSSVGGSHASALGAAGHGGTPRTRPAGIGSTTARGWAGTASRGRATPASPVAAHRGASLVGGPDQVRQRGPDLLIPPRLQPAVGVDPQLFRIDLGHGRAQQARDLLGAGHPWGVDVVDARADPASEPGRCDIG